MESRKAKLLAAVVLATTALAFAQGAPRIRITLLSAPAHPQAGGAVAVVVRAGEVRAAIDRRYQLEEVPEAMRYIGQGHARGKIVINVI
jgi:NADPH:quinone reductase-like Zn-dependent oxidoreductase